ncbi:MAG: alpha/beta fold hydrolase [Planctomycetota bacterium]
MPINRLVLWLSTFIGFGALSGQDLSPDLLAKLPGGTKKEIGFVDIEPYSIKSAIKPGLQCDVGFIVVPENRASQTSRNIGIHFYRVRAQQSGGHAPVFVLPGGPGGYFVKESLDAIANPRGGSPLEASLYCQDRDVILMNQRGARLPDKRYQAFRFMHQGLSLDSAFSVKSVTESINKMTRFQIKRWQKQGVDLAGYDIMNMVEDINDVRKALGYEKIALRGTSFGSQWSFAFIQKYPEVVDRAILSGVEPLDHGYDSPDGIWNVLERLEKRISDSNDDDNLLHLPDVSLTQAFRVVIRRLNESPVEAKGQHPKRPQFKKNIPLGVDDFRRYLRRGINARKESTRSLERLPKYIFEVYNKNYDYLSARTMEERIGFGGASLQGLLIDNSLGISRARDKKLDNEQAYQWIGELNLHYKATRDVTPTPVIPESFRVVKSDIPILMVHGDLDMSTPLENALEGIKPLSNAHLIKIIGGTHGAFHQMQRHNPELLKWVRQFLNADFQKTRVADLELPDLMKLPPIQFQPINEPTLLEEMTQR